MLKVSPKHASISTSLRLADLRLPATGFAEMRWRAIHAIGMHQEYHFLSSSRKSTSRGRIIMRAELWATQRSSYNERIVLTPKRSQPRRPYSIVHSGFIGVSRRIDDQLWAPQGSIARPTRDRAHCWKGFYHAGAY
jgi:hypothetical protein